MANRLFRGLLMAVLTTWLAGCGGTGGDDPVTGITATNLRYSQTAILTLSGNALDNAITVTSNKCSSLILLNTTSPNTRQAYCTVSGTGTAFFTVKSSAGYVVYTTTLQIPEPQVTFKTSLGDFVMELNPTAAPITAKNFMSYVNQSPSFYNSTIFHRVISGFMVQGGGYTTGLMAKTTGNAITLETTQATGLSHLRGTVGMARQPAADSATSQFFVNVVDNNSLNYQSASSPGYAVFGRVISGMDVIDLMTTKPLQSSGDHVPVTDITVTSATQTQ